MSKELKRNLRKEIDRPSSSILSLNPHGRYLCQEAINRIDELERVIGEVFEQVYDSPYLEDLVDKTLDL